MDPADRADPTEPALRIDPTDPMLRMEPTDPMDRIDPRLAIDSRDASDFNDRSPITESFHIEKCPELRPPPGWRRRARSRWLHETAFTAGQSLFAGRLPVQGPFPESLAHRFVGVT